MTLTVLRPDEDRAFDRGNALLVGAWVARVRQGRSLAQLRRFLLGLTSARRRTLRVRRSAKGDASSSATAALLTELCEWCIDAFWTSPLTLSLSEDVLIFSTAIGPHLSLALREGRLSAWADGEPGLRFANPFWSVDLARPDLWEVTTDFLREQLPASAQHYDHWETTLERA